MNASAVTTTAAQAGWLTPLADQVSENLAAHDGAGTLDRSTAGHTCAGLTDVRDGLHRLVNEGTQP